MCGYRIVELLRGNVEGGHRTQPEQNLLRRGHQGSPADQLHIQPERQEDGGAQRGPGLHIPSLPSHLLAPGGMFTQCATFVLSILSLPVSALDRKPSLQGTLHKPRYENSTAQTVTPTTSNHHPCQRHKLGAKDGPDS